MGSGSGSLSPSGSSASGGASGGAGGGEVVYGYYPTSGNVGGSTPSGSSSECTKAETNSSKYVFIY